MPVSSPVDERVAAVMVVKRKNNKMRSTFKAFLQEELDGQGIPKQNRTVAVGNRLRDVLLDRGVQRADKILQYQLDSNRTPCPFLKET